MSKAPDRCIVVEGSRVLVSMSGHLDHWISALGFFPIIYKTELDPVQAYVVLHRVQKVDWSCIDLEGPFFHYRWRDGEVIGLSYKRVHECNWEFYGHLVYHKRRLLTKMVWFKTRIFLSSIDDEIAQL